MLKSGKFSLARTRARTPRLKTLENTNGEANKSTYTVSNGGLTISIQQPALRGGGGVRLRPRTFHGKGSLLFPFVYILFVYLIIVKLIERHHVEPVAIPPGLHHQGHSLHKQLL